MQAKINIDFVNLKFEVIRKVVGINRDEILTKFFLTFSFNY